MGSKPTLYLRKLWAVLASKRLLESTCDQLYTKKRSFVKMVKDCCVYDPGTKSSTFRLIFAQTQTSKYAQIAFSNDCDIN